MGQLAAIVLAAEEGEKADLQANFYVIRNQFNAIMDEFVELAGVARLDYKKTSEQTMGPLYQNWIMVLKVQEHDGDDLFFQSRLRTNEADDFG